MIRKEEVALAALRGLVRRPRLADALFRFDRWGNILGPDRFVDPYPIYERMRRSGAISFSPFFQQWAVVGYEEAREVLASPSFGVAGSLDSLLAIRPYRDLAPASTSILRNALLFTDPPLHSRLRSTINRSFTPQSMRRLEPRIDAIARDLLYAVEGEREVELVSAFTRPLPIHVISELIGVPEDRWAWVARTSDTLRRITDPFEPLERDAIDAVCADVAAYYGELADRRRADPQDDVISGLAAAEADGDIDRDELVSLVALLILAGHETTTGALGNAIVALARHPEQRRLLRDDASILPGAVDELLRYDTALQTDPRTALETTTIAGRRIERGQQLTVMLGAANRDPRRFAEPDRLVLDRPQPSPLSFGRGIHHCLGAALARLELKIGLRALLDAFGEVELDDGRVRWRTSLAFRGPTRLPVVRR